MYLYAIGALYSIVIYIFLFIFVRSIRKDMLVAGLAWGHAGPILEYWHREDYWKPEYISPVHLGSWTFGVEDYIFAFCFAGITSGVFYLFLGQNDSSSDSVPPLQHFFRLQFTGATFLIVFGLLVGFTEMNSVYVLITLSIVTAVVIFTRFPNWAVAAIWTAGIMGIAALVSYWGFFFRLFPDVLDRWWLVDNLSGFFFLGIPIEEIIWASGMALLIGPIYRITKIKM